jgi:hypothetical protein
MPAYDSSQFYPPAPVAMVSLRNPENDSVVSDVPMLIDSGSDLTLIPESLIAELNIELDKASTYELEGFDGRRSIARSVQLELSFFPLTFRGRFVVIDSKTGILGRNVLNHFAILLDGPSLYWRELVEAVE